MPVLSFFKPARPGREAGSGNACLQRGTHPVCHETGTSGLRARLDRIQTDFQSLRSQVRATTRCQRQSPVPHRRGGVRPPHSPFSFSPTCLNCLNFSSQNPASSQPVAVCLRVSSGGSPSRAAGVPRRGGPGLSSPPSFAGQAGP